MMHASAWMLAVAVVGSAACGALESDEAKQAAEATRRTVERGVEGAKAQIERVDTERIKQGWNTAVDAVTPEGDGGSPEVGPDPLEIPEGAVACEQPGLQCTVTLAYTQTAQTHAGRLSKQVRLTPVQAPARGIRIDAIEAGSIGERVGLKTGDVVTSVNRIRVGSLQDTFTLYMQVRSARRFVVVYLRGEEERTLVVDVV